MSAPLAHRVAVVTGASSGLGLAFARLLGHAGAHVHVAALPDSGVAQAVATLQAEGIRAEGFELDVSDRDAVRTLRDRAASRGSLDIWVNNAGASGVLAPSDLIPVEVFDRVVNANIRGVFHGTALALETMREQGSGHIVNVWGRGATKPVPWQNAYASSKAWNRAFTRAARAEARTSGVQIHGYDPGLVLTDMLSTVTVAPGLEARANALPIVAGLWGQSPDDAARPLLKLITGKRNDFNDMTPLRLLTRAARSLVQGRLRQDRRITVTTRALTPPSQA